MKACVNSYTDIGETGMQSKTVKTASISEYTNKQYNDKGQKTVTNIVSLMQYRIYKSLKKALDFALKCRNQGKLPDTYIAKW